MPGKFRKILFLFVVVQLLAALSVSANNDFVCTDETVMSEDELLWGYINSFRPDNSKIELFNTNGADKLSKGEKVIYDYIVDRIKKIASGEITSASISIPESVIRETGCKYKWASDEIGSFSFAEFETNKELQNMIMNQFFSQLDMTLIHEALLNDLPYELYWYDKTKGFSYGTVFSGFGMNDIIQEVNISVLVLQFQVSQTYQAENYNAASPELSDTFIERINTAIENALYIVDKYKELSDYKKIKLYAEEICKLVEYDDNAASDSDTPYGDPWELISVFDGDFETNVVCEGYSKAFEYLCDMTDFENDVKCVVVNGALSDYNNPEISGAHMWNIVSVNGENYIVDVTNSDEGSAGQNGELILAGCELNKGICCVPVKNDIIYYQYDSNTCYFWGTEPDSILYISPTSYVPEDIFIKQNVSEKYNSELLIEFEYANKQIDAVVISVIDKTKPVNLYVFKAIFDDKDNFIRSEMIPLTDFTGAVEIDTEVELKEKESKVKFVIWDSNLTPVISILNY